MIIKISFDSNHSMVLWFYDPGKSSGVYAKLQMPSFFILLQCTYLHYLTGKVLDIDLRPVEEYFQATLEIEMLVSIIINFS